MKKTPYKFDNQILPQKSAENNEQLGFWGQTGWLDENLWSLKKCEYWYNIISLMDN